MSVTILDRLGVLLETRRVKTKIRVSERRSLSGSAVVSEVGFFGDQNSSTTHVDGLVDASRDAGSIPAASILKSRL